MSVSEEVMNDKIIICQMVIINKLITFVKLIVFENS